MIEKSTFLKPPQWNGAWINHYIVKSLAEFEQKRRRGSAAKGRAGQKKEPGRTFENYFIHYDQNDQENRTIQRFTQATKNGVADLQAVIERAT
ncbi:MAG: hypothetical protein H7Z10_06045 [Gemmatimonadaceae bacterium]|nr:hypothetical protein [Acetobacteraceae bacterium]